MPIQQFNTVAELRFAIEQLEIKLASEWPPLKEQLLATAETLKPRHIIKDMVRDVFSKPTLKSTAVSTTLGLAVMLATNFFFPTKTASQLTKLIAGTLVGITTLGKVVNNGSQIKSLGSSLLKRLKGKRQTL